MMNTSDGLSIMTQNAGALPGKEEALRQFHEAMASIAAENKKEYLEATKRSPHLVATESDPMKFIRYSSYNSWDAADRMCSYWRERCELFKERAFLPLTIDGNGALKDKDVLVLQAGFPAFLPRTPDGKQILYFDRSKWLACTDRDNRLRASFYMMNLVSDDETAQKHGGVIAVINLVQPRLLAVDQKYVERTISLFTKSIPFHAEAHLTCQLPRTMSRSVAMKKSVADCISFYTQPRASPYQPNIHIEVNEGDILRALIAKGLTKAGVPVCLGGSWTFDSVAKWCKAQGLKECRQAQVGTVKGGGKGTTPAQQKNPNQRKIMNAIFSRQKRERRKQELENLKKEHVQLQEQNSALKAEEARLQSLLHAAIKLVGEVPRSDSLHHNNVPNNNFHGANSFGYGGDGHFAQPGKRDFFDPNVAAFNADNQRPAKRMRQVTPGPPSLYEASNSAGIAATNLGNFSSLERNPQAGEENRAWSRAQKRQNSALWSVPEVSSSFHVPEPTPMFSTENIQQQPGLATDCMGMNQGAPFAQQETNYRGTFNPPNVASRGMDPEVGQTNHYSLGSGSNGSGGFVPNSNMQSAASSHPQSSAILPNDFSETLPQRNRSDQDVLLTMLQQSNRNWLDMAKVVLGQATPGQQEQIQAWLLQQQGANNSTANNNAAAFSYHNGSS